MSSFEFILTVIFTSNELGYALKRVRYSQPLFLRKLLMLKLWEIILEWVVMRVIVKIVKRSNKC